MGTIHKNMSTPKTSSNYPLMKNSSPYKHCVCRVACLEEIVFTSDQCCPEGQKPVICASLVIGLGQQANIRILDKVGERLADGKNT
jgi:hypothetical protein